MKFLLAAVNAKYIHSNLGIYSLKKYADSSQGKSRKKNPPVAAPSGRLRLGSTPLTTGRMIF